MMTQGAGLGLLEVGVGRNRDRGIGLGERAQVEGELVQLPDSLCRRPP